MIIDAHYHLEERMETVERLLTQMDHHGIERIALIPTMMDPFHLGSFVQGVARVMRSALRSRLALLGRLLYRTTVTRSGKFSVLGKTYAIYHTPNHDDVARVMGEYPDRFYGWVMVNPRVADPMVEVQARAGQPGWVGIKTHPFWHAFAIKELDDVAGWCAEHHKPLLVHLGANQEQGDFRLLPERHPELNVLYAHAGVPFYQELWAYAVTKPNVYIDLSSPYLDEPLRRAAVEAMGVDKCLYGSDGPYGYPDADGSYDHGAILKEIDRMSLSQGDTEQILAGNFLRLIGD